jgi:hypothetical protein
VNDHHDGCLERKKEASAGAITAVNYQKFASPYLTGVANDNASRQLSLGSPFPTGHIFIPIRPW